MWSPEDERRPNPSSHARDVQTKTLLTKYADAVLIELQKIDKGAPRRKVEDAGRGRLGPEEGAGGPSPAESQIMDRVKARETSVWTERR